MAAVRISERIRGNSLNAKSYLNSLPKSTRSDFTFLKHEQPRKNSTGNEMHLSYLDKLQ